MDILIKKINILEKNKIIFVFGEKFFGKHTLANKTYKYLSNMRGCNVSFVKTLDYKDINICKNKNKHVKNIFIVPFFRFDKTSYEKLLESLYNNSCREYCFILFMRPLKEIVEFNRNYDFCDNLSFLYYGIHPDNNIKNSNKLSVVHTPRINEFRSYENAESFFKDDDYAYNCICMESYYSGILVSLFSSEDYLTISLIYGGVIINNAFVTSIDLLCRSVINRPLMYEGVFKNDLFWETGDGYEVIDAWREFVIYKREYQQFIYELKELYLKIYDYKYISDNKYLDISCLKQQKKSWFNNGFTLLYSKLYNAANYRLKHGSFIDYERKCRLIPFCNRKKIANVISEYDGSDIKTLLRITLAFFEETFDFNLIINALESIYRYDIKCENSDSSKIIELAIKTAIQWNDITMLNYVLILFIEMWRFDGTTIERIIGFYKKITGFSLQTVENILIENEGTNLMNMINNSIVKKKVFISFCGADNDIADLVYDELYKRLPIDYEILKYDHNVTYMDSLKSFMNQIEECKSVLMIVSDPYLKSEGCMYEVLETMLGHNYIDKMVPIFIKKADKKFYNDSTNAIPANVFGVVDNFAYSTYWADIKKEQQETLRDLVNNNIDNLMNIEEAVNRLKKYDDIMKKINEFIGVIKDRWQMSFSELYEENFEEIINRISK